MVPRVERDTVVTLLKRIYKISLATISDAFINKKQVLAIYFDIEKAYYMVYKPRILQTLQ